jgi:hypothetical protein
MFGFDIKKLSDEELADRIIELGKRMTWAYRMGQSAMAGQLQALKLQGEQEQRERMAAPRFQQMLQPSNIIETDPDLALAAKAERDAKAEQDAPKKGPRAKPMTITKERIKPTMRPSTDN